MNIHPIKKPDFLFEISWEICNKVGGIYTVLSTKALSLANELKDNYILIGPDVWKETREHPDFIDDPYIFVSWKEKARRSGLNIRIGRWNVPGQPVVILVDFTPYFSLKDSIFFEFWEKYKLDSLSGQWDYIEPALFGYAAGRVIESFYEYNISASDRVVAQFHEWMTGTGVLYLKETVPQAGTIFTTHATVMGRSIAGNGLPLYRDMDKFDVGRLARDFGIYSKFSLEKTAAAVADCFTTVSSITARECLRFLARDCDVITVNGFEDSIVPDEHELSAKREEARNRIISVVRGLLNQDIDDNSLLVLNSGRYEFKNKGIDLYIDALGRINREKSVNRPVLAVISVPAHHSGKQKELLQRIKNPDYSNPVVREYLTHHLFDEYSDPILNRIQANNLNNSPDDIVKIVFIPAYLDGMDGVINLKYYDFLTGFDLCVFPSYYEPWGYTPLESAAFHIPAITTNFAGFGLWVQTQDQGPHEGIKIIDRTGQDEPAVEAIRNIIVEFSELSGEQLHWARESAFAISQNALWSSFIKNYQDAYHLAIAKAAEREDLFRGKQQQYHFFEVRETQKIEPHWKKIEVKSDIPPVLEGLQSISMNLWWSWNCDATELFEILDPVYWEECGHNPIMLLESLSYERWKELSEDQEYIEKLRKVYDRYQIYMKKAETKPDGLIAYFSMEYGLHESMKIYSGGLGVLAGDYLKQASDSNKNLLAIGLLYRYGYFQQEFSAFGEQISTYIAQDFAKLPLIPVKNKEGKWVKVSIALPGRTLYARVWRLDVGRTPLYLLDADITENSEKDRTITHQLYGGDTEMRLKQELLLGVGGIRFLNQMGVKPDVYHCNEGHSAFIGIERLHRLVKERKLTFAEALEVVRSSTLFTTHTPVPAGHDYFSEDLLRTYIPHYAERLNIPWDDFMALGRFDPSNGNERFSMSVLAVKLSQEVNGVSKIHGAVSRDMFSSLFPGYYKDELYITHVTNGVHLPTWTARQFRKLYDNEFGAKFLQDQSNPAHWRKIHQVPSETIWKIRMELKTRMIEFLKDRIAKEMTDRQDPPKTVFQAVEAMNPNALTFGFARRFATYKRAHLLFNNLGRLATVMNHPGRPVQIIFAGKAHPNDKAGQDLIKRIIEITKMPEFIGKIFFVENYDMHVARMLTQGVDVWLNTPTRPMEASGTSGEKAVMNGVMNLSVLDGWWAEGYKPGAGWAIKENKTYENQHFQDELDAETIYNLMEDEILPMYYKLDAKGLPSEWIADVKNCISDIAWNFTMKRMLDEYFEKFYNPLIARSRLMKENNCLHAIELASWKEHIHREWNYLEVLSVKLPDTSRYNLKLGDEFKAEIKIRTNGINASHIGIDAIFGYRVSNAIPEPLFVKQLQLANAYKHEATFECSFPLEYTGLLDYAFRIYPTHPLLAHRQEIPLLTWV